MDGINAMLRELNDEVDLLLDLRRRLENAVRGLPNCGGSDPESALGRFEEQTRVLFAKTVTTGKGMRRLLASRHN